MYIDDIEFKDYYRVLTDELKQYPNPCFQQIELDLCRTFQDDEFEHDKGLLESMRKVLCAYVKRNPMIGYCQGMNFIMARLMKHSSSEEDAFWTFTMLLESVLPINYYN